MPARQKDRRSKSKYNQICLRCDSEPREAYRDGAKKTVCNCDGEPKLADDISPVTRRTWRMNNQQVERLANEQGMVRYNTERGEVALSANLVREMWCKTATDSEAFRFIKLCQYFKLNPHLREAYIIKYGNSPAQFVIGRDSFLRRAENHPQFAGFEDGVIVEFEGEIRDIEGTVFSDGDALIGGWCTVYRKDRRVPTKKRIQLKEFDKGQAMWKTMPAYMINKCAITRALNDAFPGMFSYEEDNVMIEDADITIEQDDDPRKQITDNGIGDLFPQDGSTPQDEETTPSNNGGTPEKEQPPTEGLGDPFEQPSAFLQKAQDELGLDPAKVKHILSGHYSMEIIDHKDVPASAESWEVLVLHTQGPPDVEEQEAMEV